MSTHTSFEAIFKYPSTHHHLNHLCMSSTHPVESTLLFLVFCRHVLAAHAFLGSLLSFIWRMRVIYRSTLTIAYTLIGRRPVSKSRTFGVVLLIPKCLQMKAFCNFSMSFHLDEKIPPSLHIIPSIKHMHQKVHIVFSNTKYMSGCNHFQIDSICFFLLLNTAPHMYALYGP